MRDRGYQPRGQRMSETTPAPMPVRDPGPAFPTRSPWVEVFGAQVRRDDVRAIIPNDQSTRDPLGGNVTIEQWTVEALILVGTAVVRIKAPGVWTGEDARELARATLEQIRS